MIDQKKDVICTCSGTTQQKIKEMLDKGIDNLEDISRATGACSGCGACDTSILELMAEAGRDLKSRPERLNLK